MTIVHRIQAAATAASSSSSSSSDRNSKLYNTSPPSECRLLATSVSRYQSSRVQQHILASKEIDGPLCQYRRGFFDHLQPRAFAVSTLRVVTQQGTLIMATFMTDQLERDMKRQELVDQGKLTQAEADEQAADWEKREWEKRWQVFPSRLLTAFAKYHVVTLVMRCYEWLAATQYDKVIMDKLTMDPFQAAKKLTAKSSGGSDNDKKVARQMFHTTFWANLIAILADYSVHQVILCYVYYMYIRRKRQRKDDGEDDEGLLSSFLGKSTQLCVSRSFGLVCSAAGGAVGTYMLPGWGTVLGANMAEGVAGVILEDGQGDIEPGKKED